MSDDQGQCPGCGAVFTGARGLRAHQNGKFVSMACKPATRPITTSKDAVLVWDVDVEEMRELSRAEAAAGMVRYGRSLGPGTPACGVAEQHALGLLAGTYQPAGLPPVRLER